MLYNSTTDATSTFLDWRIAVDGPAVGSNFYLVDTAITADRVRLTALESLKFVNFVAATYSAGSLYTATGITGIVSYVNNTIIALSLSANNPGLTTLNINSLGVRTLVKLNSVGTAVNLDANDLVTNRYYFFRYNLSSTNWEWIAGNSGDQINVTGGTTGNVVTLSSTGSLLGTLTQSLMISQTVHAATAKTTPISTDEIALVDSAASNVLKRVTWSNVIAGITTSLGAMIDSATAKTTPVGADELGIADSAASFATKKVTFTNLASQFGVYINALTAKTTLASTDDLIISDSGASDVSKRITISDFFGAIGAFIAAFTSKTTPIAADSIALSDSAASGAVKNVTLTNLFAQLGVLLHAFTAKTSIVGADEIAISDSAASNISKRVTWTNIITSLQGLIALDTWAATTDITTNDSSSSKHGFLKKLSGNVYDVFTGDGNWTTMNGWVGAGITWTYASATTFTTTADTTTIFTKGTRIKLTQTTVKYFTVVSSTFGASTTVTVTGGSDYSLANAAITSPFYSYQLNPQGYPVSFNWTPAYTGFSADPTSSLATFSTTGNIVKVNYQMSGSGGTSNTTGFTITSLPISAAVARTLIQCVGIRNASADVATPGGMNLSGTVLTLSTTTKSAADTASWTNSGTKGCYSFSIEYTF